MKYSFLILIFTLSISFSASAQVIGPIQEVNGVAYYMHTVEKGQTLYSLSKFYQCDINDILIANPDAESGLKLGDILKVPVKKSKIQAPTTSGGNKDFIEHEVQRKETLFSIAQKYNVDVNELIRLNPGADVGIKKGQLLKIPTQRAPAAVTPESNPNPNMEVHTVNAGETLYSISKQYATTVEAIKSANPGMNESLSLGQKINIPTRALPRDPQDELKPITPNNTPVVVSGPNNKEKYIVTMMLPFYSAPGDTAGFGERELRQRNISIDLYRGAQLGADTMALRGFSGELFTFDVLDEKTDVKAIASKNEVKQADLIIGPAFKDPLTELTSTTNSSGGHIVIPVPQSNRILLQSANMSKAYASEASQWEAIGSYVAKTYPTANVIVINTTDVDDLKLLNLFQMGYVATKGDSAKQFKVSNRSASGIGKLLSASQKNIVVAPTSDRLFLTTLFKNLSGDNIMVIGTEEWENLDVIEPHFRNQFHIHYPKAIYLDYYNATSQKWIEAYRKKFKSEPTAYSLLGYNIMLYYCTGLQQFGRDFPNHFNELKVNGLIGVDFNYMKSGNESGFENRHLFLISAENFTLIPISIGK